MNRVKNKLNVLMVGIVVLGLMCGCGNASTIEGDAHENSDAPEEMQTTNEETVKEEGSSMNLPEQYRKLVSKYIDAINKHMDYETAGKEKISYAVSNEDITVDDLCYALIDMNEDGVDEIVFMPSTRNSRTGGYDYNYVLAMYTIENGELKDIILGDWGIRDDGYYLYDKGIVSWKLGGTGFVQKGYYHLDSSNDLSFLEGTLMYSTFVDDEPTEGWYRVTDGEGMGWAPDEEGAGQFFEEIDELKAADIEYYYEADEPYLDRVQLSAFDN